MKNTRIFKSYLISCIAIITFFCNHALAEKITVKKVKGKQAIIESQTPLEEGQTYELVTESVSEDVNYKSGVHKTRNNSFTFGTKLDFLKSDNAQSTDYSLQTRYGWNFSSLEVGGVLEVTGSDQGAGATTTVLAGGYVDYNFVPNRDPKKIIWGPFLLVGFGSKSFPASATGGSATSLSANLGAFLTYFLGDSNTALRGEAYGTYSQVNTTASQTSQIGGGVRGLLVFYF